MEGAQNRQLQYQKSIFSGLKGQQKRSGVVGASAGPCFDRGPRGSQEVRGPGRSLGRHKGGVSGGSQQGPGGVLDRHGGGFWNLPTWDPPEGPKKGPRNVVLFREVGSLACSYGMGLGWSYIPAGRRGHDISNGVPFSIFYSTWRHQDGEDWTSEFWAPQVVLIPGSARHPACRSS